jgi:hypothetical protein
MYTGASCENQPRGSIVQLLGASSGDRPRFASAACNAGSTLSRMLSLA